MDFDLVSDLSIKPAVSYGDHMYKHADEMADLDFVTVSVTAVRLDRNRKPRMKSLWHPGYRGSDCRLNFKVKTVVKLINE